MTGLIATATIQLPVLFAQVRAKAVDVVSTRVVLALAAPVSGCQMSGLTLLRTVT